MSRKRAVVTSLVLNNDMEAKHATLMQDYLELQHEFASVKDQVNAARIRKATLLAEVRFLRRRLKKLKKDPSNVKENEAAYALPQLTADRAKFFAGAIAPEPSTNISLGSSKIPAFLESAGQNGSDYSAQRKLVNESVGLANALKTSIFRNKPGEYVTAMQEKRKISWQDQISLECK